MISDLLNKHTPVPEIRKGKSWMPKEPAGLMTVGDLRKVAKRNELKYKERLAEAEEEMKRLERLKGPI